ncbi:MAG: hypothetical protein L6Q37_07375 [Bdellovibrionaceae bacterium]|nr:hypothetical protein [Pseudobdellovibrionaceae bacterium]NUM58834.1 hypothetical protein [Pseudobdellovibrionaceae bacterium]
MEERNQLIKKYFLKVRLNQNKKIIIFFLFGLFIIFSLNWVNNKDPIQYSKFNIDATIPNGYVLIPIDVINGASLSSLMGQTGIVDLFSTENGRKTKLVASRVKIVQATDQNDSFAVLLKETLSQKIVQAQGPFFAIVQNPKQKSSEIFTDGAKKITINYQN